ncbi:SIS domain-containing protein [Paenalkalicoccus suaedae]|uniref:SIS domain-containing protein n=1 Tax=Paenalkalicoccus suaedae TaxID=2592382 RepID=A0A859FA75_9BACI|nr:SIS domain-containing protein [Paenalkalicoccus suaedae]QKS69790.1 SIS domain-containing protein [Paenalkalicoccus suaedae]
MSKRSTYLKAIREKLDQVEYDPAIKDAATRIVQAIEAKKTIYTFGASHAGILSEELFYRAGGLALFNPIFDPSLMLNVRPITRTSQAEQLEGYGDIIASSVAWESGDVLLTHSVSGRNPVMIDLVTHAKERGVTVIAITNVTYSSESKSRHSTGLRLFELADIIIDNHGETGDATVSFDGLPQAVAPTSTVIGAAIVNSILVEIVELLLAKGIDPPIFYSANIDGTKAHNDAIFEAYKTQIRYM